MEHPEDDDSTGNDAEQNHYVKLYREACRTLAIRPSPYLLKHMVDAELSMESQGLGVNGMWALGIALVVSIT